MSKTETPRRKNICHRVLFTALVSILVQGQSIGAESGSAASSAEAEGGEPLWQLGFGAGAVRLPYYPGASDQKHYAFPVIYPVYRGDILKVDEDGIRGELYRSPRWQLNVSFDFNFAVDSDDVDAREGMPDLPATLQTGPSLKYHAVDREELDLWFQFPLRAVIAGDDLEFDYEGYLLNPRVVLETSIASKWGDLRWTHSAGLSYGNADYHQFYFDVAPEYVMDGRPGYRADSGYGGFRYQTALIRLDSQHLFSIFFRYDNYSGATFEDSPLFQKDEAFSFGIVYSRFLFNSKTRVK